jgi:hypothetical protein
MMIPDKPARRPRAKPAAKNVFRRAPGGLTVAIVIAALQKAGGIQAYAAEDLKVDRSTICRFKNDHPEVAEALAEINEGLNDTAESQLAQAIRNGDVGAIKFRLERQARDRGWGRTLEVSGPNGGPIETVALTPDLSKLSVTELEQMLALTNKCAPDAPANP